jgi:N-acetylgalactosamine kinase
VRGLVLFGLAECDRARLAVDLLRRGDADALGRLWAVSHDGDRVVRYDANLQPTPFAARVDDAHLAALAAQAQATAPEGGHAAHLHRQPGVYACSTPLIDRIVDLAMGVPGVKGAQIAGAGLGGCAMILAENAAVAPLQERLAEHGHRTVQYFPVEGAGVIAL